MGFSFLIYIGIRLSLTSQNEISKGQEKSVYLSSALCMVGVPQKDRTHPSKEGRNFLVVQWIWNSSPSDNYGVPFPVRELRSHMLQR